MRVFVRAQTEHTRNEGVIWVCVREREREVNDDLGGVGARGAGAITCHQVRELGVDYGGSITPHIFSVHHVFLRGD